MDGLDLIFNKHMNFKVRNVGNVNDDLLEDDEMFADGMTRSEWMIMQPEYVSLTRKYHDALIENGIDGKDELEYVKSHDVIYK